MPDGLQWACCQTEEQIASQRAHEPLFWGVGKAISHFMDKAISSIVATFLFSYLFILQQRYSETEASNQTEYDRNIISRA